MMTQSPILWLNSSNSWWYWVPHDPWLEPQVPLGVFQRRRFGQFRFLGEKGAAAPSFGRQDPTGTVVGAWVFFFSGECNSSRAIYCLKVNIQHLMTKAFPLLRRAMEKRRFMVSNWGFVTPKKSQWNNPWQLTIVFPNSMAHLSRSSTRKKSGGLMPCWVQLFHPSMGPSMCRRGIVLYLGRPSGSKLLTIDPPILAWYSWYDNMIIYIYTYTVMIEWLNI